MDAPRIRVLSTSKNAAAVASGIGGTSSTSAAAADASPATIEALFLARPSFARAPVRPLALGLPARSDSPLMMSSLPAAGPAFGVVRRCHPVVNWWPPGRQAAAPQASPALAGLAVQAGRQLRSCPVRGVPCPHVKALVTSSRRVVHHR